MKNKMFLMKLKICKPNIKPNLIFQINLDLFKIFYLLFLKKFLNKYLDSQARMKLNNVKITFIYNFLSFFC